jgi:predicted lipoprotein with Yx(FWY)xxD motif
MGGGIASDLNGVIDMRIRWWVAPGIAATAALLAACGSSSASGSGSGAASPAGASATAAASSAPAAAAKPGTSAAGLTTAKTAKGTVLVTAQGYAVYMFAIDTPTKSNCDATCLTFWPALTGTPTAASGSGLSGKFGTITGTGGITQATFDGHPLYLFAADKKPGEVNGNGINTSGGLWYALTPSGAKLAAAAKPAVSATSGSTGGYGY